MVFRCCRSDRAVDTQAHQRKSGTQKRQNAPLLKPSSSSREESRPEADDEDIKAVKWLRDRSLERTLRSKETPEEPEALVVPAPLSFDDQPSEGVVIQTKHSHDKTPIVDNKSHVELLESEAILRKSRKTAESQYKEKLRILTKDEAEEEERNQEKQRKQEEERKFNDQRKSERERRRRRSRSRSRSRSRKKVSDRNDARMLDGSSSASLLIKKLSKESISSVLDSSLDRSLDHSLDHSLDRDIDFIARERHAVAVQLLHRHFIEKQHSFTPVEKAFLQDLLKQSEPESDAGSIKSKTTAIEATLQRLEKGGHPFSPGEGDSMVAPLKFSSQAQTESKSGLSQKLAIRDRQSPHVDDAIPPPEQDDPALEDFFSIQPSTTAIAEDRKSEVSLYSATSSNSGVGVEVALTHRSNSLRKKSKRVKRNRDAAPPLVDERDDDNLTDSPYPVLGADPSMGSRLLTVRMMEALRGFLPFAVSEQNYWLKFTMHRDGASLHSLLQKVKGSRYTLMVIQSKEDKDGLFGAFTATPWNRDQGGWFGSGESFLFKKTDTMEVYPYTRADDMVQYCSSQMLAVGGGDWRDENSPFGKKETKGIGLLVDGDLLGGETYSCATFCNPRLARTNEFSIQNIEVWALTPCMSVDEAEKMEAHKMFVTQHQR